MVVDVALSSLEIERKDLKDKAVVVIDVLRATSTMIVALANGSQAFIPAATVEEAKKIAAEQQNLNFLLAGERRALPLAGFHLGNSPRDYEAKKVRGKVIIFTTTNGTRALIAAQGGAEVFIGAFLNISAVCARLEQTSRNVLIGCAGEKELFCLEDTLCAGAFVHKLAQERKEVTLSDAALMAKILYEHYEKNIYELLATCEWGRYLRELGLQEDVRICAQVDAYSVVPVFKEGRVFLEA